jgi:hypothetical protein
MRSVRRCQEAGAAVFIDNAFAVFLEELAALRRQEVQHALRRPAEAHAFRRDDDWHARSVDQLGN